MHGLQAPNAGGWAAVKLYDYSPGDTTKGNLENEGCREVRSYQTAKTKVMLRASSKWYQGVTIYRSRCEDCMTFLSKDSLLSRYMRVRASVII